VRMQAEVMETEAGRFTEAKSSTGVPAACGRPRP